MTMREKKENRALSFKLAAPSSPPAGPSEPARSSRWMTIIRLVILAAVLIYALSGTMLQSLGQALIHEDQPARADLIVIPGGSPVVRGLAAADWYRKGLAPKVFVHRGGLERSELVKKLDLSGTGDWGLTLRLLTSRGVPAEVIIIDEVFGESTLAEARRLKQYLQGRPERSLILVTSRYHSARAHRIFTDVLGPQYKIISLPSPYDPFDPDQWWRHKEMAKNLFLEYQKTVFYFYESWTDND
ncbi:MAG: YdcF family protein [Thermodesulfobacteriota bacterium]